MEKTTVATLLLLAIGVLVVLAMLPTIANNAQDMTSKRDVVDEAIDLSTARNPLVNNVNTTTYTVTNYPSGWKVTGCPISSVTYGNASTDFTVAVSYNFSTTTGVLTVYNSSETVACNTNDTYIDYTYCADGYINDSGGRAVASLILICAALGLLGFAVYYSVRQFY